MQSTLASRDLFLIGAGHTNLHIVRMWRMSPVRDVQLTVVSPYSRATYSGMLPGTLAGLYEPTEMEIDLYRFCSSCGVHLIVDSAVGLDPERREIHFSNRPAMQFDVASIGMGSVPSHREIWADNSDVLSIKPMATFRDRLSDRLEAIREGRRTADRPLSLAVVGAGAAGVEVTLCLRSRLEATGYSARITLIDANDSILQGYYSKTIDLAYRELKRCDVELQLGRRIEDYKQGELTFDDGESLTADLVIWATKAAPPPMLDRFQLPKANDGFLAVRPTLQTTADYPVFVVGDTATFVDRPVPKAGVYAVREGPVLWENIRRLLGGQPLKSYDPQSGFLSLLATGDGRAIGQFKGMAFQGAWVWKLKDYIDRKFMHKYRDYRPMAMDSMQSSSSDSEDAKPKMFCRGCGGKASSSVLHDALERLDHSPGDIVKPGFETLDDAVLLNTGPGHVVDTVSVDFFQPFLDDPYLVGRVAAINALSDIWATGAQPQGALAIVTLPRGAAHKQAEFLYQLLAGGARELSAAGAALIGGHTTEGDESAIGYTVLGRLGDSEPLSKRNLAAGDQLILTKPLGTGVLLAAHGESRCEATWMDSLVDNMLRTNAQAAQLCRKYKVTAATDVTGFGLAGHLLEMIDASRTSATLWLDRLPLLEGFGELAAEGLRSSLDPANRQVEDRLDVTETTLRHSAEYQALFDPQTSGGLLIAVPPTEVDTLLAELQEVGDVDSRVIGAVTSASDHSRLTIQHRPSV